MSRPGKPSPRAHCPRCGRPARSVKRVTLESLLRPECQVRIDDGPWYVCEARFCTLLYFNPTGTVFELSDLRVPFGIKATGPPRPVCYCFGHTIEEIEEEIARTGQSTVPEQIKQAMKVEGCRCEQTNPLGRCCLATVQAVIAERTTGQACPPIAGKTTCCCCCDETQPGAADAADARIATRAGALASAGSVTAAVLSSACCWLPLLAIALGGSAAGVAGVFERWRIPLVLVAGVLLAMGFWFAYGPPARRAACCSPGALRVRRGMLWLSTVLVLVGVGFPRLLVAMTSVASPSAAAARGGGVITIELPVSGMTCEGCAAILRSKLAQVPGVTSVDVSYPDKRAKVLAKAADGAKLREALVTAIHEAGYDVPATSP